MQNASKIRATGHSFGTILDGRAFGISSRVGFNGMEKDDEVAGDGNSYDFGARHFDPRLGRWLRIDNAFMRYPGHSSYAYVVNSPLIFVDPDGNIITFAIDKDHTDAEAKALYDTYYQISSLEVKAELDKLQASDVIYNVTLQDLSLSTGGKTDFNIDNTTPVLEIQINKNKDAFSKVGALGDELKGGTEFEAGAFGISKTAGGKAGTLMYDLVDELRTKEAKFEAQDALNASIVAINMALGTNIPLGKDPNPENDQLHDLYNQYKSGDLKEREYNQKASDWFHSTVVGKDYVNDIKAAGGKTEIFFENSPTDFDSQDWETSINEGKNTDLEKVVFRRENSEGKTNTETHVPK